MPSPATPLEPGDERAEPGSWTRQERKERTRQALLSAALDLLGDESFSSLSLRRLTREVGIVPTAFYRHFTSLDELGLALVDESFGSLRSVIRSVRAENPPIEVVLERSVAVLVEHVQGHRTHFLFIGRERFGGSPALRGAIAHELGLFERELATDLARMPYLRSWTGADVAVLARTIVVIMVATVEQLLDESANRPEILRSIVETTETQVRMVVVGVMAWTSG